MLGRMPRGPVLRLARLATVGRTPDGPDALRESALCFGLFRNLHARLDLSEDPSVESSARVLSGFRPC